MITVTSSEKQEQTAAKRRCQLEEGISKKRRDNKGEQRPAIHSKHGVRLSEITSTKTLDETAPGRGISTVESRTEVRQSKPLADIEI